MLGRTAHGEEVVGGHITDTWRVKKDGRLIWADTLRVTDEIFPLVHRKALLSDCKAVASLIYFGPDLDKRLEFLRDLIPSLQCQCAATSVSGLIVVRFSAKVSSDLRLALRSLASAVRPGARPWAFPSSEDVVMLSSARERRSS